MKVNDFNDCESVIKDDLIDARKRFKSDSTAAIEIRLQPGGEIPTHKTPESVFIYVLEGQGSISVDGILKDVSKGMVAECPADIDKYIKNSSRDLLSLLVVKMN